MPGRASAPHPQPAPAGEHAARPRVVRHTVAGAVVTAYLLAAAVVVIAHQIAPVPSWLALHLLLLGAATNAVFVWSRHFAQALLHARQGSERNALLRLAVLNAGAVAALAGVSAGVPALALTGAALVVSAVAAHIASLAGMVKSASALAGRLGILVWYYIAAGAALAVGGALGGVLAAGWVHSAPLLAAVTLAHAHLNLLGWLGLAIMGTQFMLWPTVLRTRMSEDAPRTARRVLVITVGGLAIATAALVATPYIAAAHWLAAVGMSCYLAGTAFSLVPAIGEMRARPPHTAPAWGLLAGNAWLLGALGADVAALAAGLNNAGQLLDNQLVPVLGVGVTGQILLGALTFLLPVTVGGGPAGNRRLTAILEYGWRSRAAIGNAGVLALAALPGVHGARVAGWAAVLAGFGTFPVFAAAALARAPAARARRPASGSQR